MPEASESPGQPSAIERYDPKCWLEKYGDALYNYALNRLRYHELAEEAVQEALVAALRGVNEFSGRSSERTWLFAILRHKIVDLLRNEWNTRSLVSLDDEVNPEGLLFDANGAWRKEVFRSGCNELETRELQEIVMQCIKKLPRNQATIFVLKVLQEKKAEEICQDLKISTTNYWTRLHRARLAMASCVAQSWPLEN